MAQVPQRVLTEGAAGAIEIAVDQPEPPAQPQGIALIAHPHPLFGGTLDNKVVWTLAHALRDLGFVALRPNFRGVGQSGGAHDQGEGETEDLLKVLSYARRLYGDLPVALAGFSFGAHVQTRVAQRLAEQGQPVQRLVLVGLATGDVAGGRSYATPPAPSAVVANTLVIHGENDTTVPLARVLDWARPQELPVIVVPGADHFFHRKLQVLKNILHNAWPH